MVRWIERRKVLRSIERCLLLTCFSLLAAAIAYPHGVQPPRSNEGSLAAASIEIPGAHEFFEGLGEYAQYQFNRETVEALSQVERYFEFEKEIRAGKIADYTEADADYNRYLAESLLLKTINAQYEDLIELDYTRELDGFDPYKPYELPALNGVLIFKVKTGDGQTECIVHQANVAYIGDTDVMTIDVPDAGTAYILLVLEQIPADLTRTFVAFRRRSSPQPADYIAFTIHTPDVGQFALTVADEHGEPTPALIRLTNHATKKLWGPPNAVDLGQTMTYITQMEIYGPGRAYTYYLKGPFRGPFWIVPEPFEAPLPEGEWTLEIYHGPEYIPVRQTIKITAGEWNRETIQLKRWIDMPARGWYSGDDHVHAQIMNSEDADNVMAFVRAADVHVANILEMGDSLRTYYEQRGFGPAYRVRTDNHVLVPGQEDPRSDFGHIIGMNLTSMARDLDHYLLYDWVADEIHRQGGLYGHTHVGEGDLGIHKDLAMTMPTGKSDFGSIMQNRLGTDQYYEYLNLGFKLTASAGSDVPYGGAVGITRVYAHLEKDQAFGADAWFDAFGKGRTFVTNGPMLEFTVNGVLPGGEIVVEQNTRLNVKARVEGMPGATAPCLVELVCNGEVIKQVSSPDSVHGVVFLETMLDSKYGCWLALRATGHDGTMAHTTPVYVTRKGFRHWNADKVEALLDSRLAILDDVDALVQGFLDADEAGQTGPLDFRAHMFIKQSDKIFERTSFARNFYNQLRDVLAAELEERNREEQ